MIGRLRGKVIEKSPPLVILDVQGVGYEVHAPMSTFYKLPLDKNEEVILHTHLVVREDAQLLFGFASFAERTMFRTLIKINGVGAKMALAILSGMEANEFAQCILAEDAAGLTRLPGVGKKTAERLIVELRDKLPKEENSADDLFAGSGPGAIGSASASSQAAAALESLGYKPAEAAKMVAAVKEKDLTTEEVIRLALKSTVKK
jgi:Holliday junction DNA helicase RuvA